MSDVGGLDNPFDEGPSQSAPPAVAAKPATPTDAYKPMPTESNTLEPGKPLSTGSKTLAGGTEADAPPPTPSILPNPAPTPNMTPPQVPAWLKPSEPIPFAPRPEMPAVPAPTPAPTLPTYQPVGSNITPKTDIPKAPDKGWDWGGIAGQFGQGVIKGPAKFAADAVALKDLALTGHLTTYGANDWQRLLEDTPQQAASVPYQVGVGTGYTGASIGAVGTAAVVGSRLGLAALGEGVSQAIGPVATGALAAGGAMLEGAMYGTGSAAHEERLKKNPSMSAVAISGGAGAALGGASFGLGLGLQKAWGGIMKAWHAKNMPKMPAAVVEKQAEELAEKTEDLLMEQEIKQTQAVMEALGPQPPDNALQQKQRELMDDAELLKLFNGKAKEPDMTKEAQIKALRKRFPGKNNKQIEAMAKAAKLREGSTPPAESNPIKLVEDKEQGATRKPLGNKNGQMLIGYARIDGAELLETVLNKLPPALANEFNHAVKEIGKAKALMGHFQNQVEEYAEHGLSLAASPDQFSKIKKIPETRLKHEKQMELDKLKAELFQAQGKEKARLESEVARLAAEMQAAPKKSELRQHLFTQYNRMLGALQEFGSKDLLEISDKLHVHAVADRKNLSGVTEPLAESFDEAVKDFEKAFGLFRNAEKHMEAVRKSYQPVFEEVEKHLGERVVVRTQIQAPKSSGIKLTGKTEMAVGLQYNPTLSKLVGKWQATFKALDAQLRAAEDNIRVHYMYEAAKQLRITAPGAQKALLDSGIKPPQVRKLLTIGIAGAAALNPFHPAEAQGLADVDSMSDDERRKYYGNLTIFGGVGLAVAAGLLTRKFGPHGARLAIRGLRPYVHALMGNTQDGIALADKALNRTGFQDSLNYAINEWRGHLNQLALVAKDEAALLLKKHNGEVLTPAEAASITPQGHQWVDKLGDVERSIKKMIPGYVSEWKTHYDALSDLNKHELSEVNSHVNFIADMLGPVPQKGAAQNILGRTMAGVFAGYCRAEFTINPKIIGSALLHDTLAFGGLRFGPKMTWHAVGMYTGDASIRGLLKNLNFQGPRGESLSAAATLAGKAPQQPHGTHLWLEKTQGDVMWLASLLHQHEARSAELNALPPQYRPTDAKDFVRKVMTGNLPPTTLDDTFMKASIDVAETVGADATHTNIAGPLWGHRANGLLAFNKIPSIEARLHKESVMAIANNIAAGQYGVAFMHAGRIAHFLAVKAQYAGGKAVVPVGAGALLLSNPITAKATADVMTGLNNFSLGVQLFGDASTMVSWDPIIGSLTGRVAPGLQISLDTLESLVDLAGEIGAMEDVLATKGPAALLAGSKEDKDVKKGQQAIKMMISTIMLKYGTLADVPGLNKIPGANFVPMHLVRNALYKASNVANDEHFTSVPALSLIGSKQNPAEASKVRVYDQEESSISKAITQMTGLTESQRDNLRQLFFETKSRREANYDIGVQAKSDEVKDASGLHD